MTGHLTMLELLKSTLRGACARLVAAGAWSEGPVTTQGWTCRRLRDDRGAACHEDGSSEIWIKQVDGTWKRVDENVVTTRTRARSHK